MDEIATALSIDPVELRRRNFLHEGNTTATEQLMREPIMMDQLLDRILRESDYYARALDSRSRIQRIQSSRIASRLSIHAQLTGLARHLNRWRAWM